MLQLAVGQRGRARLARVVVAGALSVGALAVVPLASADSLSGVRADVRSADSALHSVIAAAPSGSVAGPLGVLKADLKAAGHKSARLFRHAHTPSVRAKAATALAKIAAQESRDAALLTPLVGQLSGPGQVDLASFVARPPRVVSRR